MIHCSASQEGLERSLQLVGDEGDIIEMSWYADRKVTLPLGEDFHARRLSIRASQVGVVARARRHRRTNADRLELAVSLLQDPVFDAFLTGSSPFEELPGVVQRLCRRHAWTRCATSSNTRRRSPVHRSSAPAIPPPQKPRGNPCSA